jgi:multidrug efflux system outer membrane protein
MRALALLPVLLPVLLGLSGCLLGPDYVRPTIDTPATYRFNAGEATEVANTAWWEQFQDPVLNNLIAVALADNKDVKIAAARVDQFLGQFVTTRSGLFPQLGASFDAQRQRAALAALPELPAGVNPVFNTLEPALGARRNPRGRACWPVKKDVVRRSCRSWHRWRRPTSICATSMHSW